MAKREDNIIRVDFGGNRSREATDGQNEAAQTMEPQPTTSELERFIKNATEGVLRDLEDYPIADHMWEYLESALTERTTIDIIETAGNLRYDNPMAVIERQGDSLAAGLRVNVSYGEISDNARFLRRELGVPEYEDEQIARYWALDHAFSTVLSEAVARHAIDRKGGFVPSIGYSAWLNELAEVDDQLPVMARQVINKPQYRRTVLTTRVGYGVAIQRLHRQFIDYYQGDVVEADRLINCRLYGLQEVLQDQLSNREKVSLSSLALAAPMDKEELTQFFDEL